MLFMLDSERKPDILCRHFARTASLEESRVVWLQSWNRRALAGASLWAGLWQKSQADCWGQDPL